MEYLEYYSCLLPFGDAFRDKASLCSSGWTKTYYVSNLGQLQLTEILLCLPPEFWDDRCVTTPGFPASLNQSKCFLIPLDFSTNIIPFIVSICVTAAKWMETQACKGPAELFLLPAFTAGMDGTLVFCDLC